MTWGTTSGRTPADHGGDSGTRSQTGEEIGHDSMPSDPSLDRIVISAGSVEAFRQPTPDVLDDPTRFENAKQKKTTLLEGIKKFNFKPKRVSCRLRKETIIDFMLPRVSNFFRKLVPYPVHPRKILRISS